MLPQQSMIGPTEFTCTKAQAVLEKATKEEPIFIAACADEEITVIISTPNYPACTGNYTNSMHQLDLVLHDHIIYSVICISNYYYFFFNLALKLLAAFIERCGKQDRQ